jgi:hypothetical protein
VAYRRHADVSQIIGRQLRQYCPIDFVIAEGGLVSLETQAAQPRRHVRRRVPLTLLYPPSPPAVFSGTDFVRTEWIRYFPGEENRLREELRAAIERIEDGAAFYRQLGRFPVDAPQPDLELGFERFKQAVLIADDVPAREGIATIRDRLDAAAPQTQAGQDDDLGSHRTRLLQAVQEFLGLLPPAN